MGRFNAIKENDIGRFRECSSRNKAFFPMGKFTPPMGRFCPLREKIVDNFTSSREKVGEGHVPQVIPIFLGGGPSSLRYKMISPKDKFTFPKDMVGKNLVFSREKVAEMEKPVRCIIPPRVSPGKRWHVGYNTKNFPKGCQGHTRGGCRGKEQLIKGNLLMDLIKHS